MTADNKDAQEGTACGDDRALTDVEQGELYNFCLPDRRTYVLLRRLVKYGVAPEIAPFGESATGGDDRALVERLNATLPHCCNTGLLRAEAAAAIERLTSDLSRAREALGKYGKHEWDCHHGKTWAEKPNHCTCGYGAALKGEA